MPNYILEYWQEMKEGRVTVSKRIYKQYEKLIADMNYHPKYVYDEAKAERPIQFIESFCRHSKVN